MTRGRFITIEGGEGVGKTTQIATLVASLAAHGIEVVLTREPGGTPRAERLREIVLQPSDEPMPHTCELMLLFAARATHVANVIEPALQRGNWVICDRFIDSTYAYQGFGRGMDMEHIASLEKIVLGNLRPDTTLLLDAPLDVGLARAAKRNAATGSTDRMEREKREFFERVRSGYLARAKAHPERIQLIDASRDIAAVRESIWSAIAPLTNPDTDYPTAVYGT